MPAKAGSQGLATGKQRGSWILAYAGMTKEEIEF
jgi:hypothetical protein